MRATDPIAIVGVGCRFPGGADGAHAFWELLRDGVDAITEIPPDRWNAERFYHQDASAPGRMVSRWGGFVPDIDAFDAAFFGIAPREAARMDPQQRWLAEVTWEALEDAGLPPDRLAGTRTGVFVGISHSDYPSLIAARHSFDGYVNSGAALSIAANRLSFLFNFRGPSLAVDTACSSSMVALHLAAQSLRSGECTHAIVGGSNAILAPEASIGFSQARMLSPRGRCRAFDAGADGYVRSEGAAAVVLMPLSRARELGLHPRALLIATASNQDGRSSSLTVPSQRAQEEMILDALRDAEVDPRDVVYVEAHGTGTTVGDRIEIRALASTLGSNRPAGRPLLIGSVKTNIGHLEPASGLAGLIKSILTLEHGQIPPNLHFEQPNPKLPLDSMRVPIALTPLPSSESGAQFVGVNSFGFGGTNAHALLAPAPSTIAPARDSPAQTHVLPLSARSSGALSAYIEAAVATIERGEVDSLGDLCAAFALGKAHHPVRASFVADSLPALLAALRERKPTAANVPRPKIAFVFSGQGAQWWGMGRELYEREPLVRETWQRCDAISKSLGGPGILDALLGNEDSSRLDHTDIAQPALFALQASLVELWRAAGIDPDIVIGHSVGEAAAAWASGALGLEETLRLVVHRSRQQERTRGAGRMLAAAISADDAAAWQQKLDGRISVAACNAPHQLTLSGDENALNEIAASLTARGVFCRFLPVRYAFHSDRMDPIEAQLRHDLGAIDGRPAKIPMISTVTGEPVAGPRLDAEYWWKNLRQPVLFAAAIERAIQSGCNAFVEIGPHPVLASALAELTLRAGTDVAVLPSLRRGDGERGTILTSLAALYERGAEVRWEAVYERPARRVRLPAYPWQRQRLWHDASVLAQGALAAPSHPLLGDRQDSPEPAWINHLDARLLPWLSDHRVAGTVVVPAAAYLEMAAAAVRELHGDEQVFLEDVCFNRILFVPDEQPVRTCVRIDPAASTFRVLSASPSDASKWEVHAEGVYRRGRIHEAPAVDPAAMRREFPVARSAEDVYAELSAMGQTYGASFRGVTSLWQRGNEDALALVHDAAPRQSDQYLLYPPSLDSCFHPAVALKDEHGKPDRAVVVVSLRQLRIFRPMPAEVWSRVRIVERRRNDHVGDFTIYDADGAVVAQAHGLCVREIEPEKKAGARSTRMYMPVWEPAETLALPSPAGHAEEVLIFCDTHGFGERVAAQLRARHTPVTTIFADARDGEGWAGRLLDMLLARGPLPSRIIYLWSLEHGCDVLLDLVRGRLAASGAADEARWLVITAHAQSVDGDASIRPEHAGVWGFARTVQTEQPQWRVSLVDCTGDGCAEQVVRELYAIEIEPEVAIRSSGRAVRRLRRIPAAGEEPKSSQAPSYALRIVQAGRPDALAFVGRPRHAALRGEVEIEVAAAALNFRDLMKVLGIYPSIDGEIPTLGDELSGTVVSCGPGVKKLKPGDRVMGFAANGGAFASHVVVPADSVWKIPDELSFADAASIPVAFGTAWHALHNLARLRRGETILIHAAAGGVGLAAVRLAQRAGAHVLATAGSDRKRAYLESIGVDLVMDSRSLDFADEVLRFTDGRGVDVVLNSLAGAFQQKSIAVCAPHGRFVEIGKRDLYENGTLSLALFRKSLAFFAFDLGAVLASPGAARTAVRRFLTHGFFKAGFGALPVTTVPATDAVTAFRTMQAAEHIGKLVLTFDPDQEPAIPLEFWPDADGTYLVTGGPSGFGLATARWLAGRGAKHLALVSRRGETTAGDAAIVEQMREQGVSVRLIAADVADSKAVADVLRTIDASGHPLRGVFHGAMVLRDRMLADMTQDDLESVLRPKVTGAWNLHEQTRERALDSFVLFSSISSIFGSPGQANYAAANASLDALAHHRRSLGLPALSVNWGPIADAGVAAARPELARYLKSVGMNPLPADEALAPLAEWIPRGEAQVCVADVDWQLLGRTGAGLGGSPVFRDLVAQDTPAAGTAATPDGFRESMLRLEPQARLDAVAEMIVAQVATTLGTPSSEVDRSAPLDGLDSLMAVELKFRVESQTGCEIPIDVLGGNVTLTQLAERLVAQMSRTAASAEPQLRAIAIEEETRTEIVAPFLEHASAPLFDLVQSGTVNRLSAAALMSWPDDLFAQSGVAPQDFFRAMHGGRVSLDLVVETPLGAVGIFMLPLTTARITPGEADLLPHVLDGVRQATACGARSVALTGLIPSATSYGVAVQSACEDGLAPVTTGHGTTIAAVILNLSSLLEEAGRDLEDESVLFYGIGSIGLGALRLMLDVLPHPSELRLCDPYRSAHFFEELAVTLRRECSFEGPIHVIRTADDGLGEAFYDATVIVGATNVPNVLDARRLAPGTLIVDDSAPHCLNGPEALRRFIEMQDILCTEGGFVRAPDPMPRLTYVPPALASVLPAELPQLLFAMLSPQDITACVLSALLSARNAELPSTIGMIDPSAARRHWAALRELGFTASRLNYEGTPLPERHVDAFRRRFGKRADSDAAVGIH